MSGIEFMGDLSLHYLFKISALALLPINYNQTHMIFYELATCTWSKICGVTPYYNDIEGSGFTPLNIDQVVVHSHTNVIYPVMTHSNDLY